MHRVPLRGWISVLPAHHAFQVPVAYFPPIMEPSSARQGSFNSAVLDPRRRGVVQDVVHLVIIVRLVNDLDRAP